MKQKSTFFCQECGYQSVKWLGKCPTCSTWNTFVEEIEERTSKSRTSIRFSSKTSIPKTLDEIHDDNNARILVPDPELNRALGGGLVLGSLVLVGGEPGIGKSTLMLQIALLLQQLKILYVSGEESEQQLKMRAQRIAIEPSKASGLYILTETNTQKIFSQAQVLLPEIVIIDSIQTLQSDVLDSPAGSVGQVKQATAELIRFAKETNTPIFLIGHITKEGMIAGPKVLEHMVDTVLLFEGDRRLIYRILRTVKNRFGSTSEIGIYEMLATGLRPVSNPSEILISQKETPTSGTAIAAAIEGTRPLLIEVQSLVGTTSYGMPQRASTGFDQRRLSMLLAVLEKRWHYKMGTQDIFVNMAGGVKIEDPSVDLAVCMSIISSFKDQCLSDKICFAAEVGLGGELRAISQINRCVAEAEKLGFKKIYTSKYNRKETTDHHGTIEVKAFGKIAEIVDDLW